MEQASGVFIALDLLALDVFKAVQGYSLFPSSFLQFFLASAPASFLVLLSLPLPFMSPDVPDQSRAFPMEGSAKMLRFSMLQE